MDVAFQVRLKDTFPLRYISSLYHNMTETTSVSIVCATVSMTDTSQKQSQNHEIKRTSMLSQSTTNVHLQASLAAMKYATERLRERNS